MTAGSFDIAIERDGARVSLRLAGELDLAHVDRLDQAVRAATVGAETVEIDLRALTFIDSSGLKALLAIHELAANDAFTYTLLSGPPEVHRTFVLTGLDTILNFGPPSASDAS